MDKTNPWSKLAIAANATIDSMLHLLVLSITAPFRRQGRSA